MFARPVLAFSVLSVLLATGISIAYAEDKAAAPTLAPAAASPTDPDYAKRWELVQQMEKIRPAKAQVEEAVQQVSARLSPAEHERFNKMIEKAFDYDKLEKLSMETMVNLFTVAELQKMVDYFGSPEAKSIATKLPKYQQTLQPVIVQMLDAAMISQRTGGEAPPPNAPKMTDPAPATAPKIDPNPVKTTP